MYHLITASMTQSRYHSFNQYSNVKIFYSAVMLAIFFFFFFFLFIPEADDNYYIQIKLKRKYF